MRNIFVSILNFNGKKNTLECLESLKNLRTKNFKLTIIVVDNGSDERFSLEHGFMSGITTIVIRSDKNLGFSGGQNVGIKYALSKGADYVLILNNDTYVDKNFIDELLKVAEQENSIGILSPKIYFAPKFEYHRNRYLKNELGRVFWYAGGEIDWENVIGHNRGVDEVDKGQFDKTGETDIATGCCMLIKKEVFDRAGIFDDKYFLYYEDADLTMRAKNKGFKVVYAPKSMIWHKNAGSAGGSGSILQDYYITRNRLIFGFRFASIRSKLALFRESLLILFKGRLWQKRGVMDFYLGRLGEGSYNV